MCPVEILTGKEDIDLTCLFQIASRELNLCGHHSKLYKKPCRLNVRKYFFSQRNISLWISLMANHVVTAPSVDSFKRRLGDYMAGMDNLQTSASCVHHQQVQVQE